MNKILALLKKLWQAVLNFQYLETGKRIMLNIGNFLHTLLFKILLPKRYRSLTKKEIYTIIFKSDTPAGKRFDIWLLVLIFLNLILMLVDSSPSITGHVSTILKTVEWIFTVVFTFEYYLRIYCLKKPAKYIFSFYGIIDFLSIFPAYLSILFPATQTLTVLRILRTLRVFRIFKQEKFIREGQHLLSVLRNSAYRILIFMLFTFLAAVILGAVMYMFENGKNPQFAHIPNGIYWAVVTITTVGYGDVTPVTHAGRFISIVVMLLGYSIIAVPSGIVAGETIREGRKRDEEKQRLLEQSTDDDDDDDEADVLSTFETEEIEIKRCPHCGHEEDNADAKYCNRCGTRLISTERHGFFHQFFS